MKHVNSTVIGEVHVSYIQFMFPSLPGSKLILFLVLLLKWVGIWNSSMHPSNHSFDRLVAALESEETRG